MIKTHCPLCKNKLICQGIKAICSSNKFHYYEYLYIKDIEEYICLDKYIIHNLYLFNKCKIYSFKNNDQYDNKFLFDTPLINITPENIHQLENKINTLKIFK